MPIQVLLSCICRNEARIGSCVDYVHTSLLQCWGKVGSQASSYFNVTSILIRKKQEVKKIVTIFRLESRKKFSNGTAESLFPQVLSLKLLTNFGSNFPPLSTPKQKKKTAHFVMNKARKITTLCAHNIKCVSALTIVFSTRHVQ